MADLAQKRRLPPVKQDVLEVFPVDLDKIPVSQPNLDGNERAYVEECMVTGWVSSIGRFIGEFESMFAEFAECDHAVATCNGTVALHLALAAMGIGPGDEVIVPTLTYIATANAVRYCGATAVLVDVEPDTMCIDPIAVEAAITSKTKAIIVVHLYGHAADMASIRAIAARHDIRVVEDAAEAHGATIDSRRVGGLADAGVFSFFGNKIITTGEGGAVTTNNSKLADRLRLLRGQGMDPNHRYWFPVTGFNYRMTNIAAAIGRAQLERAEVHLARRAQIARWYGDALAPLEALVHQPATRRGHHRVNWLYTIVLDSPIPTRDEVARRMAERGIETRPVFYPMHAMPPYFDASGRFPVADRLSRLGLSLPTYGAMTEAHVARVAEALEVALVGAW